VFLYPIFRLLSLHCSLFFLFLFSFGAVFILIFRFSFACWAVRSPLTPGPAAFHKDKELRGVGREGKRSIRLHHTRSADERLDAGRHHPSKTIKDFSTLFLFFFLWFCFHPAAPALAVLSVSTTSRTVCLLPSYCWTRSDTLQSWQGDGSTKSSTIRPHSLVGFGCFLSFLLLFLYGQKVFDSSAGMW
jgi:quinol-cytochrome oxidoreductase complex cytochrome b subunit